jgi:hypothetical protein
MLAFGVLVIIQGLGESYHRFDNSRVTYALCSAEFWWLDCCAIYDGHR